MDNATSIGAMLAGGGVLVWCVAKAVQALVATMQSGYGGVITSLQADLRGKELHNVEQDQRIAALEIKAEEGDTFRRQMMDTAKTCPITQTPCPLRALFHGGT